MAEETIMEEREELMVSPKGGYPTLRIAHFLKPSVTSIDGPFFDIPSLSLSSAPTNSLSNKRPLKVAFNGWRSRSNNWETWVRSMHSSHQSVWKKAGIHDAIMNSTYTITRNDNLFFGFAERWCSETNTFVFPWGETTITLEDMMLLGGYSVLGDSVSDPLESRETEETKEKLLQARSEVIRSKAQKASQCAWLAKFKAGGSDIEHEAFLTFWLSRFVFSSLSYDIIGKDVIPIAIHLARGIKIALAPAVLASIYRDLSLLKEAIVDSNRLETRKHEDNTSAVTVWAPLQFVQIWAWERFLTLQPKASSIIYGEPRLARWEKAKKVKFQNIDSTGENFLWRPYAASNEKGEWLSVHQGMDEKLESFALCLRVCELVGLGRCIEQYLPHRVAMQFGLDQDLPAPVAPSNATPEIAWSNYKRPIKDKKLYIPARHCEPGVTTRYLEWWNKSKFGQDQQEASKHVFEKKKLTNSNSLGRSPQSCKITEPAVPPGFPPKCILIESSDSSDDDRQTISEMLRRNMKGRGGQPSRGSQLQSPSSSIDDDNEDRQPISQMSKNLVHRGGHPSLGSQLQSTSSSTANSGTIQMTESVVKPAEKIVEREPVMEGSVTVADDASESRTEMMAEDAIESRVKNPVNNMVSIDSNLAETSVYNMTSTNSNLGESTTHYISEIVGLEMEARISKLEKVVARLKAAKLGHRFT